MNAANIDTSKRLIRVLKLLKKGKEFTTRDIIEKAHVCAVNSCVAEIRTQGYRIDCKRKNGKFYYRMQA